MTDQKAIIERIMKLRNLAAKNPFAHEAETAARLAARLLAEHRIAEAQLHVAEGEDPTGIVEDGTLPPMERFHHWRSYVLEVLCELHGCSHHYTKEAHGFVPHVYGRPEDIELVRLTYTWLVVAIDRASVKACKGRGDKILVGYRIGMVYGIRDAMQEEKQAAEKAAPSTALALLDERAAEAARRVKAALQGAAKAPKAPTGLDEEAYERGEKKGRKLHKKIPTKRKADLDEGGP